jgi:hypothetical protein
MSAFYGWASHNKNYGMLVQRVYLHMCPILNFDIGILLWLIIRGRCYYEIFPIFGEKFGVFRESQQYFEYKTPTFSPNFVAKFFK